jgi:hypothetical protein
MQALAAFLKEAAKISGSWDLVGVYGGYYVIGWLFDNLPDLKHAVQTSAWSAGHWDSRAFCRQDGYNWMINGVNCDHLTITNPDEGSLRYRKNGADMSQADVDTILKDLHKYIDGKLAAVPAAVWAQPLDDDFHGTRKAAGDLATEAHRWGLDGNYAGKRLDGTATLARQYLDLLRSAVAQTDTLEASAAAQSQALTDAAKSITDGVVAQLLGSGIGGIDEPKLRQVVGDAVHGELAATAFVARPATP